MPRLLVLLAALIATAAFAGDEKEYTPAIPSVTVNGEKVSADTIRKIYDYWVKVYSAPGKHLPNDLLDKLASLSRAQAVRHVAVRQHVEKDKLGLSPEELKEKLDAFKAELTAQGKNFDEYLKTRGKTDEEFSAEFALRAALMRETARDAQNDLDTLKKDFAKDKEKMPLRRASQIRFSFEKTKYTAHPERSKDDAKKQAVYALERAKKGEDFAVLAKQLSDESISRDKGGDMGWIKPGAEPKPLSDALYALEKAGDIAELIESEQGFHIVKLTELKTDDAEYQKYLKQRVYSLTLATENRLEKEAKVEVEKPPEPVKPPEPEKKKESEPKKEVDSKKEPEPKKQ